MLDRVSHNHYRLGINTSTETYEPEGRCIKIAVRRARRPSTVSSDEDDQDADANCRGIKWIDKGDKRT
jgi:hypothetical protein